MQIKYSNKNMKSIRSLIMILIGMISFTALATTQPLEQKQKPVVTVEFSQPVTAVVVQNYADDFEAISYTVSPVAMDAKPICLNVPITNHFAIVTDVGWRSSTKNKNKLYFKENVLSGAEIYTMNKYSLKTIPKPEQEVLQTFIPFRNYC